jgi:hypothetical protein
MYAYLDFGNDNRVLLPQIGTREVVIGENHHGPRDEMSIKSKPWY